MSKHTPSLVLTAAAVLCASIQPVQSGSGIQAAAAVQTGSDPVPVIITTTGDALLAADAGTQHSSDYLSSPAAAEQSAALAETRQRVQARIRELYPALEIGFTYDTLLSGFSCKLPENLIEQVALLPEIASVSRAAQHTAPAMSSAAANGGLPAYYDATGCTGEGQVIAVIDSELDITNPMFSAMDDRKNALSADDIAAIADSIGFSRAFDPAAAYVSSKLPFVADYIEDDQSAVSDLQNYHGTHVAGIAAGNAVTDVNGKTVAGIAQDAQLIIMAVSDPASGNIDDSAAIAAIEDAIKLHADVINLSFCSPGEPFGCNVYESVFRNAEQAGAVICMSAGNSGRMPGSSGFPSPLNPDGCTLTSLPTGAPVLTVASADNSYTEHYRAFRCGGELFPYTAVYTPDTGMQAHYLADQLSAPEYEYVYWETGIPDTEQAADAAGKIVVYPCGAAPFEVIMQAAEQAGAAAALGIYFGGMTPAGMTIAFDLPSGFISYADGMKLLQMDAAGVHTLTFTDETVDAELPAGISAFSSWGVHQSLELRPDIMGIGGNVESASYFGGHALMSGTSMSAPYLAGCTAVLTQYLKQQGMELTGAEKSSYIRNLLMNAAVPYETDGLPASPRQQGAGFVSVNNAIADKILLTGSTGSAKIELYDGIGDNFTFDVTLTNTSAEDVTFDSAKLLLTTDSWQYAEAFGQAVTDGQIALNAGADLSALLHIPANSSRTETVSVTLDSAQTAQLRSVFANGFFAEGYLMLKDAGNCCDVSIPMLGFCGDWTSIPIFAQPPVLNVSFGSGALLGGRKTVTDAAMIAQILSRVPDEERSAEPQELIFRYANPDECAQFMQPGFVSVSPNQDGLADNLLLTCINQRLCQLSGMQILDADGNQIDAGLSVSEAAPAVNIPLTLYAQNSLSALPEGNYTARCTANIDYPASYAAPEICDLPFTVDRTAPVLTSQIRTENGRRILTLTASDSQLDGIVVTGSGSGGIAGEYDPAAPVSANGLADLSAARGILSGTALTVPEPVDTADLPLAARVLLGSATAEELSEAPFSQLIPAQPDSAGTFTVEYDITDLSAYCFAVFDAACNCTVCEDTASAAETIAEGIWQGSQYLYNFRSDTFTAYCFEDGAQTDYRFTLSGGMLTAENASGIRTAEAVCQNSKSLRLTWDDGSTETLRYQGEATPAGLRFYPTQKIEELVLLHYRQNYLPIFGVDISHCESILSAAENKVTVKLWVLIEDEEQFIGAYTVNNRTGEAADPNNVQFSLRGFTEIMRDPFTAGIWMGCTPANTARYIWFDGHGAGSFRNLEDGTDTAFTYSMGMCGADITITGENAVFVRIQPIDETHLSLTFADGTTEMLLYQSEGDFSGFTFYTGAELREMAVNDYAQTHGTSPADAALTVTEDGTVAVKLQDADGTVLDIYTLDPTDGTGTDGSGAAVNLPQTGNCSRLPAAVCTAAVLLLLTGAFAVCRSGIQLRKKERI